MIFTLLMMSGMAKIYLVMCCLYSSHELILYVTKGFHIVIFENLVMYRHLLFMTCPHDKNVD